MMSFGGVVEALRSGEAVERDGKVYRYSERRRMLVVETNGVSSSVGSLTVEQIFAEDWKIHGYAQEAHHGHAENHLSFSQAAGKGDADE